ncbi:MAG: D-tyrosyl-tRNA(Tyr) deacylase [Lachnospiraceae bacterium]|jgi:D-tyrosyl-tRNA(Tyr) deacylase|nr:D-tyrosyl-tRNA(Tyr) deacylase [Lachnospiraceae bacterium]MBR4776811.1 D-tyrosyl-tRNA(Tyr) deacylase [Lachnospiraceae bacterium]MBR4816519.1 D-tyrosyl-tRNA(Tyr) deacylase [Lachnospiraceae bacterium]
MKLIIQRVTEASVTIDGRVTGKIGKGYMVLIGVGREDNEETARKYADKMLKLRIFEDENGKTNLSISQVDGELLLVSQFTLYADTSSNRPGFTPAAPPDMAEKLYNYFVDYCRDKVKNVQTGEFGADMKVSLVNDGPFTICL